MDFVHNPYRCSPPKVGKYALVQSVVYRRVHVILLVSILLMQACRKSSLLAPLSLCGCVTPRQNKILVCTVEPLLYDHPQNHIGVVV